VCGGGVVLCRCLCVCDLLIVSHVGRDLWAGGGGGGGPAGGGGGVTSSGGGGNPPPTLGPAAG